MSWIPIGTPSWLSPEGSDIAGRPARVQGDWNRASPVLQRSRWGGVGVLGVSRASYCAAMASISLWYLPLRRCPCTYVTAVTSAPASMEALMRGAYESGLSRIAFSWKAAVSGPPIALEISEIS